MAECEENNDELLGEFADFCPEPPEMRDMCWRCSRPAVVCWCSHLPSPPVDTSTSVIILQHPFEESRRLKTAPMLLHGLAKDKCHIFSSKRFPLARYKKLEEIVADPNTILMYPSPDAVDLREFVEKEDVVNKVRAGEKYNLILLDGTWFQARGIYGRNHYLHKLKQVKLSEIGLSEYVIRTQPNDASLSTVETAAFTIAAIEGKPQVMQELLQPLRAMCKYQMEHGAVKHHSKQFLIEHGLYKKQVSKLTLRKYIETGGIKVIPKVLFSRINGRLEDWEDDQEEEVEENAAENDDCEMVAASENLEFVKHDNEEEGTDSKLNEEHGSSANTTVITQNMKCMHLDKTESSESGKS